MIDLAAEVMREEYALRLGLPADSHPIAVMAAVLAMTSQDIYLADLQAIVRDMGGHLRVELTLDPRLPA